MEIVTERQTYIFVTENTILYPANDLFPDNELFPNTGRRRISNIVNGSLLLEEKIIEDFPVFGKIFATRFEVQVYDENDLSGLYIHVYQLDDGAYHSVFTGVIDSCKLDKVGRDRKIVAYDMAYSMGNLNVAPWWEQFWEGRETATLKEVRNSLMQTMSGIPYEDVNLPNDTLTVQKNVEFTSLPFFTILAMICEISACFPHIDRDGVMRFVYFKTTETPTSLVGEYEWNNSEFEEYETERITGVQFYDSDGELKYTVGTSENVISIVNNVFLYAVDFDALRSIGQSIMGMVAGYKFKPADLHMIIGNFNLKLGQKVSTENGSFYILEQVFSGAQFVEQEIKAPGQQYLNQGTQPVDLQSKITNQKIARVSQTIDEFKIEYANFAQQTSASLTLNSKAIETEVTRAQVKEQEINGRVTTINENLSSRITQTAEEIQAEVTRAQTAESTINGRVTTVNTNLSSRITQTAESIESAVSAERTRAQNAEDSLSGDISSVDGKVNVVSENLSSRITQTANSIESAVSAERVRAQNAENGLSDNIGYINEYLSSRITQTENSITSEVSAERMRAQQVELSLATTISQTAEKIESEVTRAEGAEVNLSARITQTAEKISTKVEKGTVSSEISQESDQITIRSNRLLIDADNFTLNRDGTITCTNAKLAGTLYNSPEPQWEGQIVNTLVINSAEILFNPNETSGGYTNPEGVISYDSANGLELITSYSRIMLNQGNNMYIHLDPDENDGYINMAHSGGQYPTTEIRIPMRGGGTAVMSFNSGLLIDYWEE